MDHLKEHGDTFSNDERNKKKKWKKGNLAGIIFPRL